MGKMKDALIKLAKKATGKDVKEKDSLSNVVDFMAENYTGGSGGSITGSYVFPLIKLSKEAKGFSKTVFDFETFIDYLKDSGIEVDEPNFFDWNETMIELCVCLAGDSQLTSTSGIISISLYKGVDIMSISLTIINNTKTSSIQFEDFFDEEQKSGSLREIIMGYFAPLYNEEGITLVPLSDIIYLTATNVVSIKYTSINETIMKDLKDVDGFLNDAFIEYNPGSGSGSGSI